MVTPRYHFFCYDPEITHCNHGHYCIEAKAKVESLIIWKLCGYEIDFLYNTLPFLTSSYNTIHLFSDLLITYNKFMKIRLIRKNSLTNYSTMKARNFTKFKQDRPLFTEYRLLNTDYKILNTKRKLSYTIHLQHHTTYLDK